MWKYPLCGNKYLSSGLMEFHVVGKTENIITLWFFHYISIYTESLLKTKEPFSAPLFFTPATSEQEQGPEVLP
jgi:hypothetical protein